MKFTPIWLPIALASLITLAGCGSGHPGSWTQEQVEENVRSKLSLVDVQLRPSEGGYTGTGTNADGETFELTITQDAAAKRLDYEAEGDRGSIESGMFSLN